MCLGVSPLGDYHCCEEFQRGGGICAAQIFYPFHGFCGIFNVCSISACNFNKICAHSTFRSSIFSSISHKSIPFLFQAENLLDLNVSRKASQFARDLMHFTLSSVSCENRERRGWRVLCGHGASSSGQGQYNTGLQAFSLCKAL